MSTLQYLSGRNVTHTDRFTLLDWSALLEAVKNPPNFADCDPKTAKKKSRWITASDATSKQKEHILEHNRFTLLRVDIDDSHMEIESIADALTGAGLQSWIIHTTASHKWRGGWNRYRVYIELAEAVSFADWALVSGYLAHVFGGDDCATRSQQVMFLPCRLNGDAYEYRISEGDPLYLACSELLSDACAWAEQQEAAISAVQQENSDTLQPQRAETLLDGQVSIIDLVNRGYEWPELLRHYGYKQHGRAWLAPESGSGVAGAYLLTSRTDGKQRLFSHHTNDPCATGRCLDKFDFLLVREYGNDWQKAIKELAEQFPDACAHNRQLWGRKKKADAIRSLVNLGGAA